MKSGRVLFFSLALAVTIGLCSMEPCHAAESMAVPTGQVRFPATPAISSPVISTDPSQAAPVGLGTAATGGGMIDVSIGLAPFSGPVDIYFGYYAPSLDPQHIFILTPSDTFVPIPTSDPLHEGLVAWKTNVSGGVNESLASALGSIPVSSLPPGRYTAYLLVTPAGTLASYYLWTTEIDLAGNVLAISVNGSLCSAGSYPNKPCVTVTVCTPGTSDCERISDILLDTGSFGLRIFRQVLSVPLSQQIAGGWALAECVQYGDGSSNWGPVMMAGVKLGNEPVVEVPIQVIDATFGTRPRGCVNADMWPADAGFNGVLGLGPFAQDCGTSCVTYARNDMYYACNGSGCTGTTVALASQVQNPVALFPQDNNGIIVQLPAVSPGGVPSIDGLLIFGVGTQTNNTPSSVTAYPTDDYGDITTEFNGNYYNSFFDTGSNGLFFSSYSANLLPSCASPYSDWFCPVSTTSFFGTNYGATGSPSGTVSFNIGNFINLITSSNNVFTEIGGNSAGDFDWGLPFYFGRKVYMGLEGKASSLGSGPYFAY